MSTNKKRVPATIVIRPDEQLFQRIEAAREMIGGELGGRPSLAAVCRYLLNRGLHDLPERRRRR